MEYKTLKLPSKQDNIYFKRNKAELNFTDHYGSGSCDQNLNCLT